MLAALPLLALCSPAAAETSPEQLRRHIDVLASDAFEGRKPGTEGENKSLLYISSQLQRAGLKPAAENGWYQPVEIVTRSPRTARSAWKARGRNVKFDQGELVLIGDKEKVTLTDAPVWFVGHGVRMLDKGMDQLAGADLKGAVALILYDGPEVEGFPSFAERVKAVREAGAAAVIGIVGEDVPWPAITSSFARGQNRLKIDEVAALQGAMPLAAAARLIRAGGGDLEALLNSAPGPSFRAERLGLSASFEVATNVHTIVSHNVVGRLPGSGKTGESLLLLGHWDHLGICAPDAADRICNGAVDNASGIASLIEIASALASGPRPQRDIVFLATTAEEMGLLGAGYFARRPVVPLSSAVGAINMDTVAIAARGEPVAIIGRGTTAMDPIVDAAARNLGRQIDSDTEANVMIERQDGWALAHAGVPTIMAGGSFASMSKLRTFLSGIYHKPGDNPGEALVLGGAAEDTDLLIEVARRLADPRLYPTPDR
jgi:hypothetical protein